MMRPRCPWPRTSPGSRRRCGFKPSTEIKRLDLDVRKEGDLARSRLLHRLLALGINWGRHEQTGGKASTFHELWVLEWRPEFAVAVIEANVWGNTVESAATARIVNAAVTATDLAAVTALLESSIQAGLPSAVDPLLARIQEMAALGADVRHLLDAVLPMARVVRYGDVRGTEAAHVLPILEGMLERSAGRHCRRMFGPGRRRGRADGREHGPRGEALQILNRDDLHEEWRGCLVATDQARAFTRSLPVGPAGLLLDARATLG